VRLGTPLERQRRHHAALTGRRQDLGGEKQVIASIKDVDEREGCGIQLRDGTIVVGIFFNALYKEDGTYTNSAEEKERKFLETGKRYLGAYTISSKDNGLTWSPPSYIETKGMPFSSLEGPTDAPIEMPDGSSSWALSVYKRAAPGNQRIRNVAVNRQGQEMITYHNRGRSRRGRFHGAWHRRTKSGRIKNACEITVRIAPFR
jgi:hypothetical protein